MHYKLFFQRALLKHSLKRILIIFKEKNLKTIFIQEEKYLKINDFKKSYPNLSIKEIVDKFLSENNNANAFPSAKKIRRMTNIDMMDKDMPILTRKSEIGILPLNTEKFAL